MRIVDDDYARGILLQFEEGETATFTTPPSTGPKAHQINPETHL